MQPLEIRRAGHQLRLQQWLGLRDLPARSLPLAVGLQEGRQGIVTYRAKSCLSN